MKLKKLLLCAVAVVLVGMTAVSCKPGIPSHYLQPDELADILYDYHVAQGIAQSQNDTIALRTYRLSILKKYGVEKADFDSSMVYYTRHTELLEKVYTKISDRLNKEAVALGGASLRTGDEISSSDTTNIWRQSPAFVLSPYAATNRLAFEIKADSSYHAGDRLILDFDAQFIYQDGIRDGAAMLAVTYDNDSIEYINNSVMSSTHYHMQINNTGRLGIKSVRGYWILSANSSGEASSSTTLKVFVVYNVRLIRMHTKEEKMTETADGSEKTDSLKNSRTSAEKRTDSIQSGTKGEPANGEAPLKLSAQPIKVLPPQEKLHRP